MLYLRFVLAVQLLQYCLLSYIMAKGENYSKQYAFVLWMEDERVGVMPVSSVMKKYDTMLTRTLYTGSRTGNWYVLLTCVHHIQ